MRISPVQQYHQKPTFTSSYREVNHPLGNLTYFFRKDIDWVKFCDYITQRFTAVDKVNIYSLACSDGSEPYSLAMMLISRLGEKRARKFFPIIASDLDSDILVNAQKGCVEVSREDLKTIKQKTYLPASTFFDVDDKIYYSNEGEIVQLARAKEVLRQAVIFKQGNALDVIRTVEPEDSIVMFRNVLPYFSPDQRKLFIERMGNRLCGNSIYVAGKYDTREWECPELIATLAKKDFSQSLLDYCFTRLTEAQTNCLPNGNTTNLILKPSPKSVYKNSHFPETTKDKKINDFSAKFLVK